MSARRAGAPLAAALIATLAGASAGTQTQASTIHAHAASTSCPLKGSSLPRTGDVQWAFSESGPPSGAHPGLTSSYTHGRGSWTSGRASGTVCHEDSGGGLPARDLVLAVAGAAHLAPGVTRLGLPGVELVLPVRVSASDDHACALGTHGSVTLFASYHEVHRDSVTVRFAAACAAHDHRYAGAELHVLITRAGAQVNSA